MNSIIMSIKIVFFPCYFLIYQFSFKVLRILKKIIFNILKIKSFLAYMKSCISFVKYIYKILRVELFCVLVFYPETEGRISAVRSTNQIKGKKTRRGHSCQKMKHHRRTKTENIKNNHPNPRKTSHNPNFFLSLTFQ